MTELAISTYSPVRYLTYLIVLDSQIRVLLSFFMGHLHEESANEHLPYVVPKPALVRRGNEIDVESFHDTLQLLADVLSLHQRSLRQVVVPRPTSVVQICG